MLITLLVIALVAAQAYLLAAALHLYFPLPAALLARFWPAAAPGAPVTPPPRLAVLIAAHNEEAVIGGALAALEQQRYPKQGFDVYVVADNCHDETAAIARAGGATVHERRTEGPSTKGKALAWLWERLPVDAYGGVVILDADNQAEAGFLAALAAELAQGHAVVQGLRRAGAEAGGTAGLDGLTELCTHRIGAAGRRYLGLNGPIMGSGVGYATAQFDRLIREVGETVVEDCEWQARLALEGVGIHWTDRAVIRDEKTSSAAALGTQRQRWVAGRAQVARAYAPRLWRAGLTGNANALDMAMFLSTPPRVLLLLGFCFAALAAIAGLPGMAPLSLWIGCLVTFAFYVLAGLYLDGAPLRAYWGLAKGTLQLPRFAWLMTLAAGRALSGAAVRWVPTPHGRS